ncbi:transcriptional regulator [Pseudomonas jilinensis]|nr:transcriptional regulator [Pseudomonas sp. WN033]RHW21403.1 transcriptional regulator [Pseudomonas jilinensis]
MLMRLARVEGQIRGIQAMIRRGESCEAIAQQFSASRSALDKAYRMLLTCLIEETLQEPGQDTAEAVERVRKLFIKYT